LNGDLTSPAGRSLSITHGARAASIWRGFTGRIVLLFHVQKSLLRFRFLQCSAASSLTTVMVPLTVILLGCDQVSNNTVVGVNHNSRFSPKNVASKTQPGDNTFGSVFNCTHHIATDSATEKKMNKMCGLGSNQQVRQKRKLEMVSAFASGRGETRRAEPCFTQRSRRKGYLFVRRETVGSTTLSRRILGPCIVGGFCLGLDVIQTVSRPD
jgi:hypothetical protein